MGRGKGKEGFNGNQGMDTTADVVAHTPANAVYQHASEDEAKSEANRLSTA